MLLKATAKINLALDVLRKREDGYHEVRMIMQMIEMYDRIYMKPTRKKGIEFSTNVPYIPTNEKNIAYQAARILMDEFRIDDGVSIRLDKFIPVAAGLAGGSSDAAMTLIGMNKIFDLGLSETGLMERGKKIGADVPFCVMQGSALAEGIGEILTPLPKVPACYILICKPNINVSTKLVYKDLRADELTEHPDIDGMINAMGEGDLYGITDRLGNVLETVTIPKYPIISELKQEMKTHGALNQLMSGSGPTVFGMFDDRAKADACRAVLKKKYPAARTFLTWPYYSKDKENRREWNRK